MNCNDVTNRMDDWFDGELTPQDAARFEAHLASCADCREEAELTRRLLADAAGLQKEIMPSRDLWGGIESRLATPVVRTNGLWMRALAATFLLGGVFFAGMFADRVMQQDAPAEQLTAMERIPEGLESAAARRILPRAQVELVSGIGGGSDTQTEDVMLRNLLIVNLAIKQVEQALASEPDSSELRDLLHSLYEQENSLLRRAERLNSERPMNKRIGI